MESDEYKLGKSVVKHEDGDLPVRVKRGSYHQFSRWMDQELVKLVAQWIHTAAPSAQRIARRPSRRPR